MKKNKNGLWKLVLGLLGIVILITLSTAASATTAGCSPDGVHLTLRVGSLFSMSWGVADGSATFIMKQNIFFGPEQVWDRLSPGPGLGQNRDALISMARMPIGTDTINIVATDDQTGNIIGGCSFTLTLIGNTGSIAGTKFEDLNANGVRDIGESGLMGWTITLTNDTGVTITQTTAQDGSYNFTNLTDGNYTVGEVMQPGWIQTAPAVSATGLATYKVQISGSNAVTGEDFGNFKLDEIKGEKFNDVNGNGIKDAGDSGIPEWQINIAGTDALTGDSVSKTIITDSNGNYDITGLTPGTYTISEVIQPGYIQTAPAVSQSGTVSYTVTITNSGTITTDKDFGNFKLGEVHGQKFEDLNANGVKDDNETGLAGWNITINGTDTITGQQVNLTTTTDSNGNYNFTSLIAGTYVISETLKSAWVQREPATGNYTVIITSGANVTEQDFGNFHKGKITGGGWINITGDPKATFGIVGQYPDSSNNASGDVEYQDHNASLNIKSIKIKTVATTTTFDKKKGVITGLARVNGAGSYPFVVYIEDNAEPGRGADVF